MTGKHYYSYNNMKAAKTDQLVLTGSTLCETYTYSDYPKAEMFKS